MVLCEKYTYNISMILVTSYVIVVINAGDISLTVQCMLTGIWRFLSIYSNRMTHNSILTRIPHSITKYIYQETAQLGFTLPLPLFVLIWYVPNVMFSIS